MSSIPEVKAALASVARTALPSTQVYYGPPTGTIGPRVCVIGNVNGQLNVSNFAGTTGVEVYTVDISLSVSLNVSTVQAATTQVLADFDALLDALRADPSLGLNVNATPLGEFQLVETSKETGQLADIGFSVEIVSA